MRAGGNTTLTALASAAESLLAAHRRHHPVILPTVWDAGSARIVQEAGFPFIATSSRAVAGVLGEGDDDASDAAVIFDFVARIVRAVSCPVTADLEAGYGLTATALVGQMLAAGIVGCNLEDTDHHGRNVLVDSHRHAAYLARVRDAAEAVGVHIVINARVDTFIRHVGGNDEQLEEAIRRGRLYLEAGADCVYPIAVSDPGQIATLVDAMPGPVNVLARPGGLRLDELAALGVARISLGSGLYQLVSNRLRSAVIALAMGTFLDDV